MVDATFQAKEQLNAVEKAEGGHAAKKFKSDPNAFAFREFKRIFDRKKEACERSKSRSPQRSPKGNAYIPVSNLSAFENPYYNKPSPRVNINVSLGSM